MRLSEPPANTTSQSPRAIRRKASPTAWVPAAQAVVIVLLGPCRPWMSETWAAVMLGRYFRIHSGNRADAPRLARRSAFSSPASLTASTMSGATSGRAIGTTPVPMTTPTRSGFSRDRSRPESRTAMPEAATPKRAARPMILMLLRCGGGTNGCRSKSGTSAPILTGCAEASKDEIGRTPLLPLTQADQKASLPMPLGATAPRPVMTTLRMTPASARHRRPLPARATAPLSRQALSVPARPELLACLPKFCANSPRYLYYPTGKGRINPEDAECWAGGGGARSVEVEQVAVPAEVAP